MSSVGAGTVIGQTKQRSTSVAQGGQSHGVAKVRRKIGELGKSVSRRWEAALGAFHYRLEVERERKKLVFVSASSRTARLVGFLFGVSKPQVFPLFEGNNEFVRAENDRLISRAEEPNRDCDLQFRWSEEGLRFLRHPEAKPERLHSNLRFQVGEETFVVKLLPTNYQTEIDCYGGKINA